MAEYEYNADLWFYKGHEYRRGDLVTIDEDQVDDDHKAFIKQLVDAGTLVEPGHAEKIREEQQKAEQEAEERRLEQIEHDDAEAARKLELEERLRSGPKPDDGEADGDGEESAPKPKPGPRRTSAK